MTVTKSLTALLNPIAEIRYFAITGYTTPLIARNVGYRILCDVFEQILRCQDAVSCHAHQRSLHKLRRRWPVPFNI